MEEQLWTSEMYLEAIRTGKREGLHRIYKEFSPGITQLVTRNGGSIDDARDVFQTGLAVVFQRAREEKLELTGSFGGLLYHICRNIWGNQLQKRSFKEVSIPEDIKYTLKDSEEWAEKLEEEEKRKLIREKLQHLEEQCQKLLKLFFAGNTMEEIMLTMNMNSVAYVTKRKFICKERLVQMIQQDARFKELL